MHPSTNSRVKNCFLCWIKSHSTKFKEPDYDDGFGHWLAGFTDGEGNFNHVKKHGQSYRISLVIDDLPILEEIRNRLGCGVIYFRDASKYNKNSKWQCQYVVATMVDLVNIVIPLFDKYNLRAKKKKDYKIWKEKLLKKWNGYVDKYEKRTNSS